jgi:hypothetical protein
MIISGSLILGCGGSSSSSNGSGGSGGTPPSSGGGGSSATPPGTYTLTVNATAGSVTATQALTLTVQ